MALRKAAVLAAAASLPPSQAVEMEAALQPLMNGLGKRYDANYSSDYDAWLSSHPGLVNFAQPPHDPMFVGRACERDMLCFVMKKVRGLCDAGRFSDGTPLSSQLVQVISKSSNERRIILFTGPSGVGKTAVVKHAIRYMMNETCGLEDSPDVMVAALRGRLMFFEEDIINLAASSNVVVKAGLNPDLKEEEKLTLLNATLIDVPYVILLDDADDQGLKIVSRAAAARLCRAHTCCRRCSSCLPPARDAPYSSRRRR
jgi:hypothetical protein